MFYLNMFQVNKHWIQRHYITDMRLMTKNGFYVRYCHPMGWRVTKISKRILNLSITNLFRIFRNSPSCRISTTHGDKTPSPTQAGLHFIMVRRLQPGVLFLMGHQQWLLPLTLSRLMIALCYMLKIKHWEVKWPEPLCSRPQMNN